MRADPLTTLSAAASGFFYKEEVVWVFMDALYGETLSTGRYDKVQRLSRGSFILGTPRERNALCTRSIWAMEYVAPLLSQLS